MTATPLGVTRPFTNSSAAAAAMAAKRRKVRVGARVLEADAAVEEGHWRKEVVEIDPGGNVNYGTEAQYAAYGGEHGGVYGNTYGVEHGDGYGHSTEMAYGGGYAGGYEHNAAAATAPPIQQPILPPEVGRIGGKRGRSDMPAEILEVNQAELMKNRPREDKSKLTGMAFGPSYQPAPSAKGKPSKLHKRKHQIGSLFYDMKQKEMELAERRSKGFLTKAETQAKYGW